MPCHARRMACRNSATHLSHTAPRRDAAACRRILAAAAWRCMGAAVPHMPRAAAAMQAAHPRTLIESTLIDSALIESAFRAGRAGDARPAATPRDTHRSGCRTCRAAREASSLLSRASCARVPVVSATACRCTKRMDAHIPARLDRTATGSLHSACRNGGARCWCVACRDVPVWLDRRRCFRDR